VSGPDHDRRFRKANPHTQVIAGRVSWKAAWAEVEHRSTHDELTGLPHGSVEIIGTGRSRERERRTETTSSGAVLDDDGRMSRHAPARPNAAAQPPVAAPAVSSKAVRPSSTGCTGAMCEYCPHPYLPP